MIDVAYEAGGVKGAEDWKYEPMEVKYKETKEETSFNWLYIPIGAAAVGLVFLGVCALVAKRKKTPKKEAKVNEEA